MGQIFEVSAHSVVEKISPLQILFIPISDIKKGQNFFNNPCPIATMVTW